MTTRAEVEALARSLDTAPTFSTVIPNLRTYSEANLRQPWRTKNKRVRLQRLAAFAHARWFLKGSTMRPAVVRLTRVAPRELDPGDNLPASLKAIRDGVADGLAGKLKGGDDSGRTGTVWTYGQERASQARVYAVKIEVWL